MTFWNDKNKFVITSAILRLLVTWEFANIVLRQITILLIYCQRNQHSPLMLVILRYSDENYVRYIAGNKNNK
jgi:hypothetical protein